MVDQALTILGTFGAQLYAIFVMPGSFLLSWFASTAPATALKFGVVAGQTEGMPLIVMSLICWIALIVAVSFIWRLFLNGLRYVSAIVRTAGFRLKATVTAWKTGLVLKWRSFLQHRRTPDDAEAPRVEFDEWDMAVLDTVSEQGPGFTLSAPELAERLPMRPSRIQQSLEKLSRNKMLDSVIGSTDGFDNYRLTEAGATFVSVWQRQETRG